jgi:hypothetical protein
MTAGRKELRSARLRLEATPGTAVVPRYIFRGEFEMPSDEREVVNAPELVGIFGGTDRSYIPKLMGGITLGEAELTFEQAPLLFAAAGFGSAGGSLQGASGSTGVFLFPIPVGTAPTTQSFTIEAGDNVESEVLTYALVNELTLTFAGGEAIKAESTWIARDGTRTNASGSFSAAGTLVTPAEVVLAGRGSVWMNPAISGATFGATQGTPGNILAGEIKFSEMWEAKFPVDAGRLDFSQAVYVNTVIEGNLTYEAWNTGSTGPLGTAGQKEQWRSQQAQLMRLQWPGGTIPIGTTFTSKLLRIDLPIKWKTFSALDDQNGNSIIEGEFYSKYNEDVDAAGRGTITVVRRAQLEHLN